MEPTLKQNLRDRVLEALRFMSDKEVQLAYPMDGPKISGELFNFWLDVYIPGPGYDEAFTADENQALKHLHDVLDDVAARTPYELPSIEHFQQTAEWRRIHEAAGRALATMTPPFRSRIVDLLDLISDPNAQLDYQSRVPYVDVAAELFNQWDESYHPSDPCFLGQFSPSELAALAVFAGVIDEVADATPAQLPPLVDFMKTKHWERLMLGARVALSAVKRTQRSTVAPG